jgi:NADPH-dependent 2,4-dienoyl-CoA reductase/sulfur reductase-like enzyme
MRNADVIIVGGSAAGLMAAITVRRHYPDKKIVLIRKEKQVLVPCGIPYIFGTLGSPEKNLLPDALLEQNRIDLVTGEVTGIDRECKVLHADGEDYHYERLVLATGSIPVKPNIPGIDLDGVFVVAKDMEYLRSMKQRLEQSRDVIIIGGGFIGIEFADEIKKMGEKNVKVIEIAAHCLSAAYDEEFCMDMEEVIKGRGIELWTSSAVERISGDGPVNCVRLRDGTELKADMIILGIGAIPNVNLARDAGLSIGVTGGIKVDCAMQTTDPAIFACGDCAESVSFFSGRPSPLRLASIATYQGRIAGANVFGIRRISEGIIGVFATAVGTCAIGAAGLTEARARENGNEVVCGTVEVSNRHPGGMPGAAMLKVKLVFDAKSRQLLGGQVRGTEAAGEVVNAIAAFIQRRASVEDVALFQMGTHPALTASPLMYPVMSAAEAAAGKMR